MEPRDEPPVEEGRGPAFDFRSLAAERGLIVAAFGFALLIVKVSRVSHLNLRTSHGLIEDVGPMSVLLGTLVGHFPWIMFIISALVLWWAVGSFAVLRTFTTAHAVVATLLLLALLLLPWPYLIALAVVAAVRWIRSKSAPHKVGQRSGHYYFLAAAVSILLIADSDVWFPAEVFHLEEGDPFVGYALQEPPNSDGWLVILTDDTRAIVRHRQTEIVERLPCRHIEEDEELTGYPSLLQLVIREDASLPEPLCDG